jgi:hypothetical protein
MAPAAVRGPVAHALAHLADLFVLLRSLGLLRSLDRERSARLRFNVTSGLGLALWRLALDARHSLRARKRLGREKIEPQRGSAPQTITRVDCLVSESARPSRGSWLSLAPRSRASLSRLALSFVLSRLSRLSRSFSSGEPQSAREVSI